MQRKKGWEELRKQRHLTQAVIKEMISEEGEPTKSFTGYIKSLITNAKMGNAKAIETVNKCIEEDIIKVAQVNNNGEDVPQNTIDWQKVPVEALKQLINAAVPENKDK